MTAPTLIVIDVQRAFTDDGELIPADVMHRTALASLHDEFAEVIATDAALARL
jgi:nicotinamidase-related amidase